MWSLALVEAAEWWLSATTFDVEETARILGNAAVIYALGLIIVRFGKSRLLSGNSVFDVILAFVLGSTLSRAINGDAPVAASLLAGALLVSLHAGVGWAAFRWDRAGAIVKGRSDLLVLDGRPLERKLRRHQIGPRDLEEAMRVQGLVPEVDRLRSAHLERSGTISVVPAEASPKVVEVDVAEGVQRVLIEIRS